MLQRLFAVCLIIFIIFRLHDIIYLYFTNSNTVRNVVLQSSHESKMKHKDAFFSPQRNKGGSNTNELITGNVKYLV